MSTNVGWLLLSWLIVLPLACRPAQATRAPRTDASPKTEEPHASDAASATSAAAESALPPLPPVPWSDSAKLVLPRPRPESGCPADTGWDGYACVTTACSRGLSFREGAGCVRCFTPCDSAPESEERRHPGAEAPFDREAAVAAVSAVSVARCKMAGGPTGAGHVTLTLLPSGEVHSVVIDSAGFDGTPTGACIAERFKAVRVPKFEGAPVRVGKAFHVK